MLDKIRRARKAFLSTAGSLITAVVVFAPSYEDEYKIAVGAVGAILTGIITYLTPNKP
jgi:hypothetical protein